MEQLVKVESIKPLGQQDVFNMEVEEYENYSVDGGMIVHNCIDALRYSVEPGLSTLNCTKFIRSFSVDMLSLDIEPLWA